jgi:hypothetical protein
MENPLSRNGNALGKKEKSALLKWKIRSVKMKNPLSKNGNCAQ